MSDYKTSRTRRPGHMTTPLQVAETRFGRLTAWAVLISLLFNLIVPLGVAAAPEPVSVACLIHRDPVNPGAQARLAPESMNGAEHAEEDLL